jgi:hypothetical protein
MNRGTNYQKEIDMEMLNNAFEDASLFKDMLEKLQKTEPKRIDQEHEREKRAERRLRERFEAKQASRIARGLA